ncbi:hypothetical protein Tco_1223516 [Tanacetum coccineum]
MSAMANTAPVIATVKNIGAKEKAPNETDAMPRANILNFYQIGLRWKLQENPKSKGTAPESKTSSVASKNRMEILNLLDPTLDRSLLPVKDGE